MSLRGDYLVIQANLDGSGQTEEDIAETTSCSIDFSAEALETTSQDSGLNASFIGGKVSCTITGDFLLASSGTNFTNLFTVMNAGTTIYVRALRSGTEFLNGEGVITGLSLAGGNSDQLVTGSYSIQCSGNMAAS